MKYDQDNVFACHSAHICPLQSSDFGFCLCDIINVCCFKIKYKEVRVWICPSLFITQINLQKAKVVTIAIILINPENTGIRDA